MKKLFYLTAVAAALLLSACAKVETSVDNGRMIAFQAANYATKVGISGTQFPTTETFGVFAWTDGTTGPYFMDNEVVAFQEDELWKTNTAYYWPINQTVDFFGFYPAKMEEITVDKTKITYKDYDVAAAQQDVMYADKDVAFADYPDRVPGSVSGYTGVPVIFHHALAKLRIDVALAYNHKKEADGTETDWTVTLNSVSLEGLYKKGGLELTLADEPEIGLVPWVKPEGNVWTNDGSVAEAKNYVASATALTTGDAITAVPEMFVLPQKLAAGQQKVKLNVTIKTRRNGADFLSETFDVSADLLVPQKLEAWQMNHSVTYRLTVNPTRSNGSDPTDPSKPVDPNDPNLTNVTIMFDPAVSGWDNVDVDAALNL